MYLLEALCQEDVSGWSCISCLYPVEEDLLDKILDSHFSGCWWQSCQMETISMLRCLVIVGLERSSSLSRVSLVLSKNQLPEDCVVGQTKVRALM